jgi:hypothetical protein
MRTLGSVASLLEVRNVSLDCPFLIALSVFSNVYLPIEEARNETIQQYPEGLRSVRS